ncbi:hypothetical protein A3F07_02980 [candidate division WWE3 bacterium RIFCSPHIGHO2_12_FULL_38_15]|uniref:alanine--tRNA ligase n=1 Tax=candidate division WWE3 bacterium RIFCSPHIGHO2_02_FULL_38_14 TaxID=1802620 RepID=A0A1F4V9S0_UNCKA|nr:MAG: hypothetical protein A2793_01480 [candidate division WWE3 bacterium RIFCSPHIGHO2_01_FULL_38_45]OGC49436.1 MAG: hypothetical protein A3F07_02980 [candidate division WWE3 bacterium RIFCSPHIGHO2_12_FULL_38_15]OGC52754.1 MAG: hypothetical protein A3B64_01095 [candidate division WWE3 bacterium RIFCSPLOWO2_01_FULL_37_24]OGC53879.1 MAG: hypothetical protein A3D91_01440 [candidate division WWE3 bacterium RIFCSPHIGHO2_02_FULL_38_14]HLB52044.1 alanine--tRNA ligase [Patescibacteria group bacterium
MEKTLSTSEILEKYFAFFKSKGHKQIPNVSLVPEGDSTLLFVNSGMFPLVPYLSGQQHPLGRRLVNVQRAGRFQEDLEEVGDHHHTTAFHMIGNWSLGDYFKDEQLPWAYEFLVEVVGLDPKKLFATVFAGDEYAPKDTESIEIIKKIFSKYKIDAKENERIFTCGRDKNWWQRGEAVGELGGPDSEVYYYLGSGNPQGMDPTKHEDEFLEIGNSVFMQYKKTESGWEELPQKNVDFGGGLERIAMVVQGKTDIYETDNFWPMVEKIKTLSGKEYKQDLQTTRAMRILADHIRGATFMAMDGVEPSNKDQGYVLRRLLRRMVRAGKTLSVEKDISVNLVGVVVETFKWLYPDLPEKKERIEKVFEDEEIKFRKTLNTGAKEVAEIAKGYKGKTDSNTVCSDAFNLYQSYGYPVEMFLEDLKDGGFKVNSDEVLRFYNEKIEKHKELSRAGAEQKFKGGLADQGETTVKYHTVNHLLQAALRKVLGDHVIQRGSNITSERIRFDFSHDSKLSDEQITETENLINEKIVQNLSVNYIDLPKEEAEKTGAIHAFGEKYGGVVRIYYIGDSLVTAFSKEFCGGPHVKNTGDLEPVRIYKQESIGKGIMRVYVRF